MAGFKHFVLTFAHVRHFQVNVFWVVTSYGVVVGYQRFRCPCCFLKMEAAWTSETLVCFYVTTRHHNPEDHELNLHRRENLTFRISKLLGHFPIAGLLKSPAKCTVQIRARCYRINCRYTLNEILIGKVFSKIRI